ncbi:SGNH/GDSL hydrolase family protein [Rhodococcus sp. WS3]|nr:SGNH/GDSL hydrolase family protein [Rhodococcus sp. WS3]
MEFARCGFRWLDITKTATITAPMRKRLKALVIGTSFSDNSGSVARLLDSWVWGLAHDLDIEFYNFARSGAGYITDAGNGNFTTQLNAAIASGIKFDLSIFEGSGNDSTEAEVAIAAAAVELYAAHAAAFPQTRRSPSAPDLAGPMVRPARRSRKCCARSGPRRPPRRTSSH